MSDKAERTKFEAWIGSPPYERRIDRHSWDQPWPEQYSDYYTQLAWEAWQAAKRST